MAIQSIDIADKTTLDQVKTNTETIIANQEQGGSSSPTIVIVDKYNNFSGVTFTIFDSNSYFTHTVEFPDDGSTSISVPVEALGTWNISWSDDGVAYSQSIEVDTVGGVIFTQFTATINATVILGTGATINATDGTHTYTATESAGSATLSIHAAGTYTITAELLEETGVITDTVEVTTDGATYTANVGFADAVLGNNGWDTIAAISAAGTAAELWDVGDCKAVDLSGTCGTLALNATYYAFVIGFDHNAEIEGNGITFQGFKTAAENGKDTALCDSYYNQYQSYDGTKYFQMNHWGTSSNYNTNYGGWPACDMRYDILGSTDVAPSGYGSQKAANATGNDPTDTCATNPKSNTLMSCLPAALRAVMKPITKWTDGVGNSSNTAVNLRETKDYLPLLAEFEIHGTRSYANEYEQTKQKQYDYYKNGNSKIKYKHLDTSTAVIWWVRSAAYNDATTFCTVYTNGYATSHLASDSFGLAPAFRV